MPSIPLEARTARLGRFWLPFIVILAGIAAYSDSFRGVFVYDDPGSIERNPTIRHLWPIGPILSPPGGGLTVSGRPMLNLTLAFNYAWGKTNVWSYHAVNLAIHLLAGVVLYGIARRAFARAALPASLPAFTLALLWTLHPLQTESVTYIVQRAESLMGLFYLLTLYGYIRSAEAQGRRRAAWAALSFLACLGGMATKEVMVSAPVIALLYDRTFISGSFGAAWRRHRPLLLALAATWIPLAALVVSGGGRSGSVGFGVGVSWWAYAATQFEAIVHYLRLTLWPTPLAFDYGTFWVKDASRVIPYACEVTALVALTAVALRRWPAWGFLGFWFFAVLAPTSLVPGTTQMIAEHRMYLALAPALAALVGGGFLLTRRNPAWLAALIVCAAACGVLTFRRNRDYRSDEILWADTVAKRPENPIAHNNLGTVLEKLPGRVPEAIAEYREALRLKPDYALAHNNLGGALALEHNDRGGALANQADHLQDAIAEYQIAIRLKPDLSLAHNNLGNAWAKLPGHRDDAIAEYQAALRFDPGDADAHYNLGRIWSSVPGHAEDAVAQYQAALNLRPEDADAHFNLGKIWSETPGRLPDAAAEYQAALRLNPNLPDAHNNLANAWLKMGRLPEAIDEYEIVLRLNPNDAGAHFNLGNALVRLPERRQAAIGQYQEALHLAPGAPAFHLNLALAFLMSPGHAGEAVAQLREVLRLEPGNEAAQKILIKLGQRLP